MGIKGFYGYCTREIKDCYKSVSIKEQIDQYKSENNKSPLILMNLSTLSYHYELKAPELVCGYQLNRIKSEFESFLEELTAMDADLEFVFKKIIAEDKEFLRRRLRDYHISCEIMENIGKVESFEKLESMYKQNEKFPYNTLILVALIQSAEKYGVVHGCNIIKGKPAVQQIELAKQRDVAFIMGLDTFYFLLPGSFKIWCDSRLDMSRMTIQEVDPSVVMNHFQISKENAALFACLIGDLQSDSNSFKKVLNHFGKNLFQNAAKFINKLTSVTMDDKIQETIDKIFGIQRDNSEVAEDFKNTIKTFEIDYEPKVSLKPELLEILANDFVSFAEEIVHNKSIFINPVFTDLRKIDMPFNDLVLPIIQKTCGILLKNTESPKVNHVIMLKSHKEEFSKVPIIPIMPEFDVPSIEMILAGGISTYDKMKILFWIMELDVKESDLIIIPEEFIADCVILLYLMKKKSLKLIDARCILKTLVDARRGNIYLEHSTEYPDKVNERAFRCSFLYTKMYFLVHSCLSSLGLKYLCPEISFDGVYFQKMYRLNIAEASSDLTEEEEFNSTEIIDAFVAVIRM